jgi:hypothetical protein
MKKSINHQSVSKKVWSISEHGLLRQIEIHGHRVRIYDEGGDLLQISTIYPHELSPFARVTKEVESIVRKGIHPHGLPYHTYYKLRRSLGIK